MKKLNEIPEWMRLKRTILNLGLELPSEVHDAVVHDFNNCATALTPELRSSTTSGAGLIAAERDEQINKHGWDVRHDADYGNGELMQAAAACLSLYAEGPMCSINVAGQVEESKMWPWQSELGMTFFHKIERKSAIDKLKVAGALIAAEIDRLQNASQNELF